MSPKKVVYSELPVTCPVCGRRFSSDEWWISTMRRILLGVVIGVPAAVIWSLLFIWISGVVILPRGIVTFGLAVALYGWPLLLTQWFGRRWFWPTARLKCAAVACQYDQAFLIAPETIPEMYDRS